MKNNEPLLLSLLMILALNPWSVWAQEGVSVGGMNMDYQLKGDSIEITIEAPTQGWVGIGFNQKNDIVHSDLLLFHVVDGQAEVLDMYVRGVGDPRPDSSMGGTSNVQIKEARESDQRTTIKFSRPIASGDKYDFQHKPGEEFWLILAYSTHDEFDHHSRMRKHVPFQF